MKLSRRLQTIFNMLPSGGIAADVGSDHGKLIISLLLENKISKGYAIENKKGPFLRLKKEIENYHLSNKIIAMFSDGVSELPSDTDKVVVAGMGGNLIINILKSHQEKLENVEYIIVDPHNAIKEVREEISNLNYHIVDEEIIKEDDIYYEIILFKKGMSDKLTNDELEYGPILLKKKSDIFINKYKDIINSLNSILSNDEVPEKRKAQIKAEIERIEAIL